MKHANRKEIVIFIIGPTAIGKTGLAVKLAGRAGGEIISADSMQIYKGMGILSQAPLSSEKKKAKHHLAGILSPAKEYNAAIFRSKAAILIRAIIKRKAIPIIAGGSGLYTKALIDGLFPSPEADPAFRNRMQRLISRYGSKYLHKRLTKADPVSASRIHPNDVRRVIRALEIYHSTGHTMTELKDRTKGLADEYDIRMFGIIAPREKIYSNINSRVDNMFRSGVLKEVKILKKRALSKTAKAALGYKEISDYLNGKCDLESAKEELKMNTRRYAKRQLTWFRADKRIRWFDMSRFTEDAIVKSITKEMR